MPMGTTPTYGLPAPAADTPAADYDTEFATAMTAADASIAAAVDAAMHAPAPSTRLAPALTASFRELFQSGHSWGASGSGTGADDTSVLVKGTQSARFITAGDGAQTNRTVYGLPALDLTGKAIRLVMRFDDTSRLNEIGFYVGSAGFSNYFLFVVHQHADGIPNFVMDGEWATITFGWEDVGLAAGSYSIGADGSPSTTSGFTDLQVTVYDDSSGPLTWWVQSVEVIPSTAARYPNGVVSITFDDSWGDVWDNARPEMDIFGYRGTNYTIAEYVGAGDRMSVDELRQLQDVSGWEIAGHSNTGASHDARYTTLTAAAVDEELRSLRRWLVDNGFRGDGFAYPGGEFWQTTDGAQIEQLAARYFSHGRTVLEQYETAPAAMPMRLRSITGINDGSGLGGITVSALTAADGPLARAAGSGGWVILAFHRVTDTTPTANTEISQSGFASVMSAINGFGLDVVPVGEVLAA